MKNGCFPLSGENNYTGGLTPVNKLMMLKGKTLVKVLQIRREIFPPAHGGGDFFHRAGFAEVRLIQTYLFTKNS